MLPELSGKWQKAFSLVELLIVIIIISIVYFLGFSGIEKPDNTPKALTPLNLKTSIENAALFQGEGTLLCIDQCKQCYFRKDISEAFEAYENRIDLKETEAYTLDSRNALLKEEYGRYQDQKICLVLHFYPNGSSTQIILKQKEHVYFLPAFFGEAREVASLEEAKEQWLKESRSVASQGDYY